MKIQLVREADGWAEIAPRFIAGKLRYITASGGEWMPPHNLEE